MCFIKHLGTTTANNSTMVIFFQYNLEDHLVAVQCTIFIGPRVHKPPQTMLRDITGNLQDFPPITGNSQTNFP